MGKKERNKNKRLANQTRDNSEKVSILIMIRGHGAHNRRLCSRDIERMYVREVKNFLYRCAASFLGFIMVYINHWFDYEMLKGIISEYKKANGVLKSIKMIELAPQVFNDKDANGKSIRTYDASHEVKLNPKIELKPIKEKFMYQKSAIFVDNFGCANLPQCMSNGMGNNLRAVVSRVLMKRPGYSDEMAVKFAGFMRDTITPKMIDIIDEHVTEDGPIIYDIKGWLEHLEPSKKRVAEYCFKKFETDGLDDLKTAFTIMPKAYEKLTNLGDGVMEDPRAIIFQNIYVRAVMGPFFYAVGKIWEKRLKGYKVPGDYDHVASELHDLVDRVQDYVLISLDYSRFDAHEYLFILEQDMPIYEKIFDEMHFEELYLRDFVNKNKNQFKIIIKHFMVGMLIVLSGQVPTGKGNTTEGNTRRNLYIMWFLLWLSGLDFEMRRRVRRRVESAVLAGGDDTVLAIIVSKLLVFLKNLENIFVKDVKTPSGLGQKLKRLDMGNFENINFLSLDFLNRGDTLRAIRPLNKVIQMVSWSTKLKDNDSHFIARKMMWCEGFNLASWGEDLPIIGELSNFLKKHGTPCERNEIIKYTENPYMHTSRTTRDRRTGDADLYRQYLEIRHCITSEDIEDFRNKLEKAGPFDIIKTNLIAKLAVNFPMLGSYTYNLQSGEIQETEMQIYQIQSFEEMTGGILYQAEKEQPYMDFNLEAGCLDQEYVL